MLQTLKSHLATSPNLNIGMVPFILPNRERKDVAVTPWRRVAVYHSVLSRSHSTRTHNAFAITPTAALPSLVNSLAGSLSSI